MTTFIPTDNHQWLKYVNLFTNRKRNMTKPRMLCDYFLSPVTDGLQPNAEESGTGCRRWATGLWTRTHTDTHTHTLHQECFITSTTSIHHIGFVVFMSDTLLPSGMQITVWHLQFCENVLMQLVEIYFFYFSKVIITVVTAILWVESVLGATKPRRLRL